MTVRLEPGDCIEVMRRLAAEGVRVDAIVCDPPYGLEFMGKGWDGSDGFRRSLNAADAGRDNAFGRTSKRAPEYRAGNLFQAWCEEWAAAAFDLLPPGGHLVAFGGTRTYHRMACAIEDAGFEIRDSLSYLYDSGLSGPLLWAYGSGFPKSHNIGKKLDAAKERCSCEPHLRDLRRDVDSEEPLSGRSEQDMLSGMQVSGDIAGLGRDGSEAAHDLLDVRQGDQRSAAIESSARGKGLLQPHLLGQDAGRSLEGDQPKGVGRHNAEDALAGREPGAEERRVEGRGDVPEAARELRVGAVREMPAGPDLDGADGRLCDGASARDGEDGRSTASPRRMRASRGSQAAEQHAEQSGALAGQPQSQDGGAWPHCGRCGKPVVPDGLGTALKPAFEPICLARKPLIGTVAANVLQHGTGALNIDCCRVEPTGESRDRDGEASQDRRYTDAGGTNFAAKPGVRGGDPSGRWPANLLHDGSDEVMEAFAASGERTSGSNNVRGKDGVFSAGDTVHGGLGKAGDAQVSYGDTGSAARFFFSAKAGADDRWGSKHPTVKPVDLMRWLVRLVTPPGGTVLDPFAGSGTTGVACLAEGFNGILIEKEAEYQADILARLDHYAGRGGHSMAVKGRKGDTGKARGTDTPLFKGLI
jgi:DNA modification methylase